MQKEVVRTDFISRLSPFWVSEELTDRTATFLPNRNGLQEYYLVIKPGHDIYNKVSTEKANFHAQYLKQEPAMTTPYITVAGFLAKESMEETMIRWIQRICSRQKSFTITLNNYSGFPPHTIYLRVQDHEPFQQLATQLKIIDDYVQSNGCPQINLVTRPHLSIAKQLPENIYEKAMPDYSRKIFCESFVAGELMLLRKEPVSDTFKVINIFGLLPQEPNFFN